MPRPIQHDVRVEVEGRVLRTPIAYSIDIDALQPADAVSLTFPLDLQTWRDCPLDGAYTVYVDDAPVCSGFIGDKKDGGDGSFTVSARDRTGRLVDESVPGAGFLIGGRLLSEVVLEIVRPWYTEVELSNARDRNLRRGGGKKALAGTEPFVVSLATAAGFVDEVLPGAAAVERTLTPLKRRALARVRGNSEDFLTRGQFEQIGRRIEAGTSRWEALVKILRPLGLMAWGAGDGRTLVVAQPNFTQAPQYAFRETLADGSNVLRMAVSTATEDRYARIEVSGSGRDPFAPPPPFVPSFPGEKRPRRVNTSRVGVAKDGPNDDGTGGDFRYPKRLFVISEHRTTKDAQKEAERALARGKANALTVDVTAPHHGQVLEGANRPTLFAPDTVATVYKEVEAAPGDGGAEVFVETDMYVTRVQYTSSRDAGEQTNISLVPLGTYLVA